MTIILMLTTIINSNADKEKMIDNNGDSGNNTSSNGVSRSEALL